VSIVKRISINSDFDIVAARMQAREVAKQMGFDTADQARISLAASELARVIAWNRTQQSEIILSDAHKNGHQGLQVVCLIDTDYIQNGDKPNQTRDPSPPRRSLSGARQLMDESKTEVLDDKQARVTLLKWLIKNY
jgi:serine/threonine-protein kinase RsbT